MLSLAGGSRAPLGLLLISLYLPGLFARSIGAPEEKASPHSGKPSFTGLSNSGQPQPKLDPVNNELPRVLPQDSALPEGSSGLPHGPAFWGPSPMEPWLSEDPQQEMAAAAAAEDDLEQVPPEGLPYLSRGSHLPEASSALVRQPSPEVSRPQDSEPRWQPGSRPPGTEAEAFAQHPFWFLSHRFLPSSPGRILNPGASWGGGGAGTGWGTRPMPYPSGIWGSNGQVSGTSMGGNSRFPVGSWGGNGRGPAGGWVGNGRGPAGGWGAGRGNGRGPAGGWAGNGRGPVGGWAGNGRGPVGGWGGNGRGPAGGWVGNGRGPVGGWAGNGRGPAGGWAGTSWRPGGSWGTNCGYPAGSWGPTC
ncbi:uncharacterized protein C6orf15 homolog [Acomys russatus]|uniref:uncharacterized protein C6orf15 homolog n=1 Tax=Acomys russatus TaxID=60746 RepID=UPI0021E2B22E|nr:uncharacterized protein C6orf15 homolog [Acomys russatus]